MTHSSREKNVGENERVISAIAGTTLLSFGLKRRSLGGLVVAAAGGELLYRALSGHCQMYQWLGKNTADAESGRLQSTITIGKSAEDLHRLWRDPASLSKILGHFVDVEARGDNRLHWKLHAPMGNELEWDAEIVDERPGESLRWRSCEGAPLPNDGEVHFRQAAQERGTEVRLAMHFEPPGGALGKSAMAALGPAPKLIASHALRRFKSLAETGEIPTLRHNPSGRASAANAEE
jgi:uncharacterized membrane protein